jgi:hypothetical protein
MPSLIALLVAVIVAAGGAWYMRATGDTAGYERRGLECRAELAAIDRERVAAEREAQSWRERGRTLADQLAAQAEEHRAALAETSRRMRDEIDRRARAHRVALDGALVRLLNERAVIRERTGDDRAPGTAAPESASTDAAAPAAGDRPAGGGASERSVARWIATAGEMYETCRTRLHALQGWARGVSTSTAD